MKVVDSPLFRPKRCVVMPHIDGLTQGSPRFVDALTQLPPRGGRVYVSEIAVRHMMSVLGWKVPAEVEVLEGKLSAALAELDELRAECDRLREVASAVEVLRAAKVVKPARAKAAA